MIVLVGERANGAPRRFPKDLSRLEDVRFLFKFGAFRHGPSRLRLNSIGLRWDRDINLLWASPRKTASWTMADRTDAAKVAAMILDFCKLHRASLVICGGRAVQSFFGSSARFIEPLSIGFLNGILCMHLPHPSPKNLFWNKQENFERARLTVEFFNSLVNG